MKRLALVCVAAGSLVVSAQAQLFGPSSLNGAFWGSLIGGMVGSDCHHGFSGQGAAIGAGVGLVAGAIVGEANRYNGYDSSSPAVYPTPSVTLGYGYGSCGTSAYVYYSPNSYYAPNYYYNGHSVDYSAARPNYAVNGTFLGAASGALIGSSSHDAGKGAAIGAASGLVLGSLAEIAARRHESRVVTQSTETAPHASAAHSEPLRPEITSKPSSTSTYYWTARPQIADAPRVPDAPTF
jgi:uncharacterized protein YcfJ